MNKFFIAASLGLAIATMSASAHAQGSILSGAAKAAGLFAPKQTDSEVNVQNSEIKNDVNVENGLVIGTSGVRATGKKVTIKNSDINTTVKIKNAGVLGTSGVQLGN